MVAMGIATIIVSLTVFFAVAGFLGRAQRGEKQKHGKSEADHRSWPQRGGYDGYRIPDEQFRGYFGVDNGFRIGGLPFQVMGGHRHFRYNGYWLGVVDPWPRTWPDDWYDTDEVYIVSDDSGYYLYNRRYPDVGLAISVSL